MNVEMVERSRNEDMYLKGHINLGPAVVESSLRPSGT